jgi:hypothetical protein
MMRGRTVSVLVFVALLSLLAADITVGCGSQAYVYGPVTQKYVVSGETDKFIMVEGRTYAVPDTFYYNVNVGDVVKYNGKQWSVVKKGP